MPPKTWESNPCGGICPLRGYPRAIPQVRQCWVTALAAAGFQPSIESAAPGGKEAPTTRRGGQPAAIVLIKCLWRIFRVRDRYRLFVCSRAAPSRRGISPCTAVHLRSPGGPMMLPVGESPRVSRRDKCR